MDVLTIKSLQPQGGRNSPVPSDSEPKIGTDSGGLQLSTGGG
jgi:hypothetical protein